MTPGTGTTADARRELQVALAVAGAIVAVAVTRLAFWMWGQVDTGDGTRFGFAGSVLALYAGALYCLFTSARGRPFGIGLAIGWAGELAYWVWLFLALAGSGLE